VALAMAAQDKYTVKVPNGLAFSEFRGYEDWQVVGPSQTDLADGGFSRETERFPSPPITSPR